MEHIWTEKLSSKNPYLPSLNLPGQWQCSKIDFMLEYSIKVNKTPTDCFRATLYQWKMTRDDLRVLRHWIGLLNHSKCSISI